MSKLIGFDIIFANNPPVFFSGQTVSGTVVVHLRDAMQMRGIRARIHGRAYTRVEVSRSRNVSDGHGGTKSEHYTETYDEYQTYLDHQVTLWGKHAGDLSAGNPVLPAGRYDFNFNFILPTNIRMPSSFENGDSCNIRYMVVTNIDKPWKFDHVAKRAFTLLESIDVNHPSLLLKPYPLQNEKSLCCFCCKTGPLKLTGSIDRCGYCPGEGVLINAECENLTNRKMSCVRARLYRTIRWCAQGHSDWVTRTDFEIRSPGQIDEGATFSWKDQLVTLPSIPPTISCGIIGVTYEFQIAVVVPRSFNLSVSYPVVIGTIPLRMNHGLPTQFAPPPPPGSGTGMPAPLPAGAVPPPITAGPAPIPGAVPSGALQTSSSPGMAPPPAGFVSPDSGAPNLAPRGYQACSDGAIDIKDRNDSDYLMGERNFVPMYSFVNSYQLPPPGSIPTDNPTASNYQPPPSGAIPSDNPTASNYQPPPSGAIPSDNPTTSNYQPSLPEATSSDNPTTSNDQPPPSGAKPSDNSTVSNDQPPSPETSPSDNPTIEKPPISEEPEN